MNIQDYDTPLHWQELFCAEALKCYVLGKQIEKLQRDYQGVINELDTQGQRLALSEGKLVERAGLKEKVREKAEKAAHALVLRASAWVETGERDAQFHGLEEGRSGFAYAYNLFCWILGAREKASLIDIADDLLRAFQILGQMQRFPEALAYFCAKCELRDLQIVERARDLEDGVKEDTD